MGVMAGLGALLLLAGCAAPTNQAGAVRIEKDIGERHPFAPASVRVHPLTHVDSNAPGLKPDQAMLVLHFELRDAYGDAVKALGEFKVELYRPGAGVTPGIETRALTWNLAEMREPDGNSGRFDPATRTYRVPLVAPGWVGGALASEGGASNWVKLRVVYTPEDGTRWLEGEYVLAR